MLASSLLIKKREGDALSDEEIRFLVQGYCSGEIADYQMAALAMAVCLRGMDARETATLTRAMLESGDRLQRLPPPHDHPRLDKHSTGGLGDKVSLVLAPLLASVDVDVPMISGRGLGHTGGTLDKLESLPGFRTDLDETECHRVLQQCGAFIVGASQRIAPADRKLYALRDVTGTVESTPLITASILSKKLAANLDGLVMDVKVGSAAFMKTVDQARSLAQSLVHVGKEAGLPTSAILSDMDQPLGEAIGNAIEVNEAIEVLRGKPGPVRDLTLELCCQVMRPLDEQRTTDELKQCLKQRLDQGYAMERFERMVAAQGGLLDGELPLHPGHAVLASRQGYVTRLDCQTIGETIVALGGGRRQIGDTIDPRVGIHLTIKVGDRVEVGERVMTLYCEPREAERYAKVLESALEVTSQPVTPRPLVIERVFA